MRSWRPGCSRICCRACLCAFRVLGRRGGYDAVPLAPPPMLLDWLLLASVGLYALQIAYSADPAKGAENLAVLLHPVWAAVCAVARGAVDARTGADLPWRGGCAGGPVCRCGLHRVLPQIAVPEPESGGGERVRQLFQGQLAVLRPEHLRPLPGACDDRRDDRRAVESRATRAADRGAASWLG